MIAATVLTGSAGAWPPGPGAEAAAAAAEIEIRGFNFSPDTVRVVVDATVRWINRDDVGHTSTADRGEWASPLIEPGKTYSHRFREAGTYTYYCTPHPFMRGVIVVEPK